MKKPKYMAKGGNPKYMAKGGNPKYMSKGGAALQSEMKANPGISNMPKSVAAALKGVGTRAKGQANLLRPKKTPPTGGMK
jgi:hypothetical protein